MEEAMKKSIAAAAASLLVTSFVFLAPAGVAHADDDFASRSGHCSLGAHYTMTVREREHPDRLATTFHINATKGHRAWTMTIKRNHATVFTKRKVSNDYGNVRFAKTIKSEDKDLVSITVKSGYDEICKASIRLDNDGH